MKLPAALTRQMLTVTIRRDLHAALRGLYLRGPLPSGAAVLAPNHHSWWDGYVLREVAWQFAQPFTVLMLQRQLAQFPFLALLGARSVRGLRPAARAAQGGHWVVIFPEGQLESAGPLRRLAPGAAWVAAQASAPLIPVALRVVMRGQRRPEAYLRFGPAVDAPQLERALSRELALLDQELLNSDPEQPLAGYLRLFGAPSMGEGAPNAAARQLRKLT